MRANSEDHTAVVQLSRIPGRNAESYVKQATLTAELKLKDLGGAQGLSMNQKKRVWVRVVVLAHC
jgi:hypothetical protein